MPTRETYKLGIDVLNPAPEGTGGDLIQDNFKTVADQLETQNTALNNKAPASHSHDYSALTTKLQWTDARPDESSSGGNE